MKTVKAPRIHNYDGAKALRLKVRQFLNLNPAKFSYAFTGRE